MYKIAYHPLVVSKDIPKLSSVWKSKIRKSIETKLATHPDFYGKPLRRTLKGYKKLRVGDYRVIFSIKGKTIKVLAIQHRSVVYGSIEKRI